MHKTLTLLLALCARSSTTKPRPITRASPGITCSSRWRSNSSDCPGSASTARTRGTSRVGPAQALSYKLGQLKFRELRNRAEQELGAKFDIRSFHDEMLSGGVLPLDLLDSRTTTWIQARKLGAKSIAAN